MAKHPIDDKQFVESPLPNVHVKTITLSPAKDNKISLRLDMMVQERLVGTNPPLWFENEDFLNALTIVIVAVTKKQSPSFLMEVITQKVLNLVVDHQDTWISNLKFKDFISNSETSLLKELKSNYSHMNSDGETAYDIPFEHTFEIEGTDYLTCYCIPILDLSAILDPADLDETTSKIIGNITVENVINNDALISEGQLYKTSDGKIWQGPTHVLVGGGFYTGFTHSDQAEALTVENVPNNKIQDFRLHQEIEAVKIDLDFVEKHIFVDNPIKLNTNDIEKNESYFSDFFTSRTSDGQVNFLFGFNHEKACRSNSKFGSLMERSSEMKDEILTASQLTGVTVSRRRITNTQNQSKIGTSVKNEPFEKNEKYQEIISASPDLTSFKAEGDNGSIEEVSIEMQEEKIRFFTGNDKNIANSEKGFYQYDVKVEIVDGAKEVLKNKLEILMTAQNTLQEYYVRAIGYAPGTQKLNFHLKSRRFTSEFIKEINDDETSFSTQEAAIANYVSILGLLGDKSGWDSLAVALFFLNVIDPETGSPEGISIAVKSIGDLVARLTELLGMETVDKGSESSSSQTPKNSFIIEKKFYSTVDNNTPSALGINYFSNFTKTNGLASIKENKYKLRVTNEIKKYYKSPTASHTSYFSPTNIDLPGAAPAWISSVIPASAQKKKYGQTAAFLTTGQRTNYLLDQIAYTRETLEKKNIKITPHLLPENQTFSNYMSAFLGMLADSDTVGQETDDDGAAYLKSIKEKEYKPLFASLTQESDHNLPESIEFFEISGGVHEALKGKVTNLPIQLSSLINQALAYKNWQAETKDLFSNSELFPILLLNYLLLVGVEYLVGFGQTGVVATLRETSLLRPQWSPVMDTTLNNLEGKILCRIKKYSNNEIGMKYAKVSAPINNEYFFLENK